MRKIRSINVKSFEQAFELNVVRADNPNACWSWKGMLSWNGYPRMSYKGKVIRATRFSYEKHNNVVLDKDQIIRHTCDNPACCNPLHLLAGTQKQNYDDSVKRNRRPKYPYRKLTDVDVFLIRILKKFTKLSNELLAQRFKVSDVCISLCLRHKTFGE